MSELACVQQRPPSQVAFALLLCLARRRSAHGLLSQSKKPRFERALTGPRRVAADRAILKSLGSVLMRKTLFLICILGMSCASWAQGDRALWTNLSALRPGQKIEIVAMNSTKHSGLFVSFSETAILYQDAAGGQTIPKQEVRKVRLMENKHHVRNIIIGGVVGAGVGAGIGAAKPECSGPDCINVIGRGTVAAIGATIGAAVGAVVGLLIPSHHTIYSVS